MKKCLVCEKGTLVRVEDIVLELDGYVFVMKGERCDSCKFESCHSGFRFELNHGAFSLRSGNFQKYLEEHERSGLHPQVFEHSGVRPSVLPSKEEFPFEEETQRAINAARKLGVWPEPMKLYRHLSKSGGGLLFRVPADLERQLNLNENTEIGITKIGNKIVIAPEVNSRK